MILQIKSWLISLCVAAVAGEALLLFSPSKRLGSLFSVVVSVFFLTAFLSPLIIFRAKGESILSFFDLNTVSRIPSQKLEKRVGDQYAESIEKNLNQVLADKLSAIDVQAEKIDILIHTDEDKSIWINQVLLTLDEEYEAREGEITDQVGNLLGYQTQVIFVYRE